MTASKKPAATIWRVYWNLPVDGSNIKFDEFFESEKAATSYFENAVKCAEGIGIMNFRNYAVCCPVEVK